MAWVMGVTTGKRDDPGFKDRGWYLLHLPVAFADETPDCLF